MKDGFVRVAAATPAIRAGDCAGNAKAIIDLIKEASAKGAGLVVFPELCVTGCTAGDLLLHKVLLDGAEQALCEIAEATKDTDALICVGAALRKGGRLYNCAVFVQNGTILGVVPKKKLLNFGANVESRYFTPGNSEADTIALCGRQAPFGANLLFACANMPEYTVSAAIGEDECETCAAIVASPCADAQTVGRAQYRRLQLKALSGRNVSAIVRAGAGQGESSADLVFAGHNIIAENGEILAESAPYETGLIFEDVDLAFIEHERRRMNMDFAQDSARVEFRMELKDLELVRKIDPMPFIPSDPEERKARCEEILNIQAHGLATRMRHIHCKSAVLAVSGGLDSTLALLVIARAFDICALDHSGITTLTMPCFGTTSRTRSNAQIISERLGTDFKEIRIEAAVKQHFADIGHDMDKHDVTFENSQARERTQVLMDYANKTGGLAIGTGDLSELALGWATYNGDHMSMYGVNGSVPKTLVRYLVAHEADRVEDEELANALRDILATPVSPELLPPVDGEIAQKTEDLVGPYELHDFFIYHLLRRAEPPEKVARLARIAFAGVYDEATIRAWLKVFARRFFNQQFKRSCMPDGPKVGSVGFSPRGDWRMPSDAVGTLWQVGD